MIFAKKKTAEKSEGARPSHIAFIMDGNGRWAKKRGMPREYGHIKGAEKFKEVVRHCGDIGINTVTVYAFSTENWHRPENEVSALMKLLSQYIEGAQSELSENKIRFIFLGDKSALPEDLRIKAESLERASKDYTLTLNIALNYGGRAELVHAFNSLIKEGKTEITEKDISSHLYTKDSPDPDLIVRTGGDYRISNFLLYQAAYAELCFTKTLWPDLTNKEIDEIVEDFSSRHRRFGGL
ncbi:MAG: di-trans,poly-cis-decaprenylcistransferase [Clostridia bacterium]|jgi:undecaprenyl diphosphate synthase|nr:di-trans,poly-cis-decaprenylcistransferase [Clostridia bacterium]